MKKVAERKSRPELKTTLAAIVAHPLRARILAILDIRVASPNELAVELAEQLGTISYHVRRLLQLDVIELVDEKQRRGAVEHFYRGVERPLISDEDWALLKPEERQSISQLIFQLLMADASNSLSTGKFGARPDSFIVRNPGYVDEQGWAELGEIFNEAHDRVFDVFAASAKRRTEDPETASIHVEAGLTFFELPSYEEQADNASGLTP